MANLNDIMSNTTVDILSENDDNAAVSHLVREDNALETTTENTSIPENCVLIRFNESGFLPWDNPDNLVSAEVEDMANRLLERVVVPVKFLIGGPANVINMAVFYKQGLKERINLCLFALSLADGLYLIFIMLVYGNQIPMPFYNVKFGPWEIFVSNTNIIGFFGMIYVSQILSAIIATERCFCIISPLKFQTMVRTRTMAVTIICVYIIVLGLYFFMVFKFTLGCAYDPVTRTSRNTGVLGEFYKAHSEVIDYLDSFVFGAGIPGVTVTVVTIATTITTVKLRQIAKWRAETSSSTISAREIALTKVLIGNSVLFIACITPLGIYRFTILFFPDINAGLHQNNLYFLLLWITDATAFTNSTCNFFVYYIMGSRYRETFWALFGKKQLRKHRN